MNKVTNKINKQSYFNKTKRGPYKSITSCMPYIQKKKKKKKSHHHPIMPKTLTLTTTSRWLAHNFKEVMLL